MKLSAQWIRDFVDVPVNDRQLAEDLTSIGIAVEGISGEGGNAVFEMEIGTNRPDAMNHYGVAREAAAFYRTDVKPISAKSTRTNKSSNGFEIRIEDPDGCARYTAQIIRGVNIESSPEHIAQRLALVDQRAINNAADASNYTLWEMGHPTHAFDLDLLQGGKIIVRKARASETLKTLDGVDRKLSPEDLIIADATRPVALAGVMGGFDTMITEKTKNILIESAWFDPIAVRKTAKRLGMHTDASHRFERGADYGATSIACALVAERIINGGGGKLDGPQIDAVARKLDQAPVLLRLAEVKRILGGGLETHEVVSILKRLGFDLVPDPADIPEFSVCIPTWRLDVEREIDVIEEIARLHGYNRFPNSLPAFAGAVIEDPGARKHEKLRSLLLALGYNEAVSLTFISHHDAETFSSTPIVELANPLSDEAKLMRSSLLPGMLDMVAYNLNRGTEDVRLFEIGDIFEGRGAATAEHRRICFAATASALRRDLPQGEILDRSKADTELDLFRRFKGDLEALINLFEHDLLSYDFQPPEYYASGRSARAILNGEAVAYFGPLSQEISASRKLRQEIYVAEIFTDRLLRNSLRDVQYRPLPKFPGVERDFSFVFDDSATFGKIKQAVQKIGLTELRSFDPIEIFRGGSIPPGKYSILLRAKFQSLERTLREDEVTDWSTKIVSALQKLGGAQRA